MITFYADFNILGTATMDITIADNTDPNYKSCLCNNNSGWVVASKNAIVLFDDIKLEENRSN